MPKTPIALQLYTVRDDTAKDFIGTIKKVAEIGYPAVELAGYDGMSVQALKSLFDDLHLKVVGCHVDISLLETEIAKVIDEKLSLGIRYINIPYLSEDRRQGSDGYKKTAQKMNEIGETLRSHGLKLGYHNHDFEFQKQDNGQYGLDILVENTDPSLVTFEVDAYWVMVGGEDPVSYISKLKGRVPLLHIKDRDPVDGSFAEIGTGNLPLDALVSLAPEVGNEWLIVEQDTCKRPPLESAKISYDNLKARGYA